MIESLPYVEWVASSLTGLFLLWKFILQKPFHRWQDKPLYPYREGYEWREWRRKRRQAHLLAQMLVKLRGQHYTYTPTSHVGYQSAHSDGIAFDHSERSWDLNPNWVEDLGINLSAVTLADPQEVAREVLDPET